MYAKASSFVGYVNTSKTVFLRRNFMKVQSTINHDRKYYSMKSTFPFQNNYTPVKNCYSVKLFHACSAKKGTQETNKSSCCLHILVHALRC